jgi:hypothetical protein
MYALVYAMLPIACGAEPLQAAPKPAPDVVVVCPSGFTATMGPWIEHRQKQGHAVGLVVGDAAPIGIKAALKRAHAANDRLCVLIVGDAAADATTGALQLCIPTHLAEAKVNVVFGSEPQIATDNWYVDFDDDGVPEAPIGRLPVDSEDELAQTVKRIIDYEQSPSFGPWRRRVNLIAGIGGFGVVADTAIESAAKTLLTRHLPPAYETTLTQASWQSPYCPGPPQFRNAVLGRFNEGALMWVYMGHGWRSEVDRVVAPDGLYPILSERDAAHLAAHPHPPLAVFLSCYSGAFDGPEDCLAETMLRQPGGPIAVLAGSRVTMPYAMSILGQELMTAFFSGDETDSRQPPTLGQIFRDAKRATAERPRTSEEDKQFDALAKALMPMAADLDAQRREHLQLFNLLGDPLLRMPRPAKVEVQAPREVRAGETIDIAAELPTAGRATIELVVRRDRLVTPPEPREVYDLSPAGRREFTSTYERANDTRLATATFDAEAGRITPQVTVPAGIKGDCHVRVYVESPGGFAMGSADVKVLPARRTEATAGP